MEWNVVKKYDDNGRILLTSVSVESTGKFSYLFAKATSKTFQYGRFRLNTDTSTIVFDYIPSCTIREPDMMEIENLMDTFNYHVDYMFKLRDNMKVIEELSKNV